MVSEYSSRSTVLLSLAKLIMWHSSGKKLVLKSFMKLMRLWIWEPVGSSNNYVSLDSRSHNMFNASGATGSVCSWLDLGSNSNLSKKDSCHKLKDSSSPGFTQKDALGNHIIEIIERSMLYMCAHCGVVLWIISRILVLLTCDPCLQSGKEPITRGKFKRPSKLGYFYSYSPKSATNFMSFVFYWWCNDDAMN